MRTTSSRFVLAALTAFVLLLPRTLEAQDAVASPPAPFQSSGTEPVTATSGPSGSAQQGTEAQQAEPPPGTQPPMLDHSIEAASPMTPESVRKRRLVKWNEFEGPWITLKFGGSAMYDVATYSQDEDSATQFDLEPAGKWRDFRFVFSGRFPKFKRKVTWKAGLMFEGSNQTWLVRETGIIVEVPELSGHLFVGRTKEGFSMTKLMAGTSIWGLERSPMLDATIPIMADGVRWMGYLPKRHVVWNLGFYNEQYSQSRHVPYQDRQAVLRLAWLPIADETNRRLLHLGVNLRWAEPQDGQLQLKARPEANPAPYFIDTGSFPAKQTFMAGPEVYYGQGSWIAGTEYYLMKTDSPETGDPLFHGGDAVVSWLITGESRGYSTRGGLFGYVYPKKTVFEGGKGAWEATLRLSYIDTDDGTIDGGKFWRISPLIAWYLSDGIRLTFGYGYGVLDRFDTQGGTHFFQSRLHVMF